MRYCLGPLVGKSRPGLVGNSEGGGVGWWIGRGWLAIKRRPGLVGD